MADGKTLGEIYLELVERIQAKFASALDQSADEEWVNYSITFNSKLRDDAPPWIGTDYTETQKRIPRGNV